MAYYHGAELAESAKFVKMGSMLGQFGKGRCLLTAAIADALKAFRQTTA